MALNPKNISLNELCSNCRPSALGVTKQLRPFELLIPYSGRKGDEKGKLRVMSIELNTSVDFVVSAEEIESVLSPQTQTAAQTESKSMTQTESQSKARLEIQPTAEPPTAPSAETLVNEPLLEQPSDSNISTGTEEKRDRWIDVYLSDENVEVSLSVDFNRRNIFARLLSPFVSSENAPPSTTEAELNVGESAKARNEGGKGWISVKCDPDWEVVNDEEKKEMKFGNEVKDWVDVKR